MAARRVGVEHLALGAIILLAAIVRLWGIGAQSIWYDEWSTVQAVNRRLPDTLTFVAEREGSPPGYFIVAWFWIRIFGRGDGALRALSAVAGIAVVPVAFAIVRQVVRNRAAAVVAALLVAVHPLLVWYSQEARPYSLLTLLGALSFLFFVRAWTDARPLDLYLWGVLSAAAITVHYFAAFLLVPEAVVLVLVHRQRMKLVVQALVPVAVVGVALVPMVREQRSHAELQSWITDFALSDRLADAGRSALTGPNPPSARLWLLVVVPVVAAVVLAIRAEPATRRTFAIVGGIGLAGAIVPLAALPLGVDLFLGRYLLAALVPLLVAAAIGLTAPSDVTRWVGLGAVAVFGVASLVTLAHADGAPAQQRPPWREVADAFDDDEGAAPEGRLLVVNLYGNLATPLWHYVDDGARPLGPDEEVAVSVIDVVELLPSGKAPCNFLVGSACAYLFLGGPLPPPLDAEFARVDDRDIEPFRVTRYRADQPVAVSRETVVEPHEVDGALVLLRP